MVNLDDLSIKHLSLVLLGMVTVIFLVAHILIRNFGDKPAENIKRKLNRIANGIEKFIVGSILIGLF